MGSEMCIRDSVTTALAFSGESVLPVPIAHTGSYAITSTPVGTTCLLYTSDAADERSSVDLGGRRIIKKKKDTRDRARRDQTQITSNRGTVPGATQEK